MVSSALAIRSALPSVNAAAGRFVAGFGAFRVAAPEAPRDAVLLGFLDMSEVPDGAALSGLGRSRKRPK
jgi:hypothetical protein